MDSMKLCTCRLMFCKQIKLCTCKQFQFLLHASLHSHSSKQFLTEHKYIHACTQLQLVNMYMTIVYTHFTVPPEHKSILECSSKFPSLHVIFHALAALKQLVSLLSRLVACSARIVVYRQTDTYTRTQKDYCNPRCACAPKIVWRAVRVLYDRSIDRCTYPCAHAQTLTFRIYSCKSIPFSQIYFDPVLHMSL